MPSAGVTIYGQNVSKFLMFLFVWGVFNFPHPCTSEAGLLSSIADFFSGSSKMLPLDTCLATAPAGTFQGYPRPNVLDLTSTFCSFVGIKYGEATDGDNRFAKPKPAKPLDGINLALVDGPFCAQSIKGIPVGSEDCLVLNVYTPNPVPEVDDDELKAVIVYIHGGGWFLASSSSFLFAPDPLMLRDVIVVTFNYRLAAFGFLSLQIPGCSGNQGLWDQNLALRWVHDNIRSFGGDPNRVTLMGESAGGWSVHVQSLSPQSQIPAPLFTKTIIQSAIAPRFIRQNYTAHNSIEFTKYLGYEGDTNDREGMLKYLKGLSTVDIQQGFENYCSHLYQNDPEFLFSIMPFYASIDSYLGDDAFLPGTEEELGEKAPEYDVIAGYTSGDGTCFFFPFHAKNVVNETLNLDGLKAKLNELFPSGDSTEGEDFQSLGIGKSSGQNSFSEMVNKLLDLPSFVAHIATSYDVESQIDEIEDNIAAYLNPKYTKDKSIQAEVVEKVKEFYFGPDSGNRINQGVKITVDLVYYRFYDQMADLYKASYNKNKIYNFQFSYNDTIFQLFKLVSMGADAVSQVEGVSHIDDVTLSSFYIAPFYPVFLPTPQDRRVIESITKLFTNFAKTGNPNSDDDGVDDEWKPITPTQNSYLRLDQDFNYIEERMDENRRAFWDSLPHS